MDGSEQPGGGDPCPGAVRTLNERNDHGEATEEATEPEVDRGSEAQLPAADGRGPAEGGWQTQAATEPALMESEEEILARALHESGRLAVEKGLVLVKGPTPTFIEWPDLAEGPREGRRLMARWLLDQGLINREALAATRP
jgi:hypothetical protein